MVGRHLRTSAGLLGAVLRDTDDAWPRRAAIRRRAHELLEYVGVRPQAEALAKNSSLRRPAAAGDRTRAWPPTPSCSRWTSPPPG